jgi:hypothetical protein
MTDTDTEVTKRLVIGRQQWGITDEDAKQVAEDVREAMMTGTRAELVLLDPDHEHRVTVYLNGAVAASVEIDLLKGPRPSEMSKTSDKPGKP